MSLTLVAASLRGAYGLKHISHAHGIRYGLFALHLYLQSFAPPRQWRDVIGREITK